MKKLGLFALISGLVIAFAMPVLAFTIEGAKGEKMYIDGGDELVVSVQFKGE